MHRRDSLQSALLEIEEGSLADVSRIVVSRAWWEELSAADRQDYQQRCLRHTIELHADDRLSRHFVEVLGAADAPALSSERRV
jgi:hypothetical protein